MARTYPGGRGLVAVHDTTLSGSRATAGGGWEPDMFAAYNRHFVKVNPWIPNLDKRPVGRGSAAEVMLPRAELIKTEFYQDFLRRAQLDTGVGVTIERDGSRHLIISILFPHAPAERDPDTIGRLQRLVPHVLRVAQLNRQFAGIETRATAAEAALQHLATALLIVDGVGRVEYQNEAAAAIIAAGDGLLVIGNRLAAIDHGETQALRRLVADATRALCDVSAAPGGVIRIRRRSGCSAYEALVAPLAASTFAVGLSEPAAAVFVRDPGARTTAPIEWLRRLYRLTPAESRLLRALLAGDPPAQIAERRRDAAHAAQIHLPQDRHRQPSRTDPSLPARPRSSPTVGCGPEKFSAPSPGRVMPTKPMRAHSRKSRGARWMLPTPPR